MTLTTWRTRPCESWTCIICWAPCDITWPFIWGFPKTGAGAILTNFPPEYPETKNDRAIVFHICFILPWDNWSSVNWSVGCCEVISPIIGSFWGGTRSRWRRFLNQFETWTAKIVKSLKCMQISWNLFLSKSIIWNKTKFWAWISLHPNWCSW